MGDLLSQLRDIRGLDAVSWWPPAPGWWMVLGLLMVLAGMALHMQRRREEYRASWQADMRARLAALRADQSRNVKQKAAELSELMRLIAMRRFGRDVCAGRQGREWLGWLAQNDPEGFRWDEKAAILADAPYMPDEKVKKTANWDEVVMAAERWLR